MTRVPARRSPPRNAIAIDEWQRRKEQHHNAIPRLDQSTAPVADLPLNKRTPSGRNVSISARQVARHDRGGLQRPPAGRSLAGQPGACPRRTRRRNQTPRKYRLRTMKPMNSPIEIAKQAPAAHSDRDTNAIKAR